MGGERSFITNSKEIIKASNEIFQVVYETVELETNKTVNVTTYRFTELRNDPDYIL